MLRATVTFGVVLSFMVVMLPAHGSRAVQAEQTGGGASGQGPSTLREPQGRLERSREATSSGQAPSTGSGQGARGGGQQAGGAAGARVPPIDERTNGMQKIDGFFPLYWDE